METMTWTPTRIRLLRRRLELTERQFARVLGYSQEDTIVALERGVLRPTASVCEQLDLLRARAEERRSPLS